MSEQLSRAGFSELGPIRQLRETEFRMDLDPFAEQQRRILTAAVDPFEFEDQIEGRSRTDLYQQLGQEATLRFHLQSRDGPGFTGGREAQLRCQTIRWYVRRCTIASPKPLPELLVE